MNYKKWIVFICLLAGSYSLTIMADSDIKEANIMLIVDGSLAMNEPWGADSRIDTLRASMKLSAQKVAEIPSWGFNMGIRIFGDQTSADKKDCADLRLGAPIEWYDPNVINNVLEGIKPKGTNCMSHGIYSAQDDFKTSHGKNVNSIILITSGADDCKISEFDAVDYMIKEKKAIGFVHIIGLNISTEDADRLKTVAERANGRFINVTSPSKLSEELVNTIHAARGSFSDTPLIPGNVPSGAVKK